MGGTVENDIPFYCHQGEGGHKNTKQLQPGELFRVRLLVRGSEPHFHTIFATFLYENEASSLDQAAVVTMATRVL